MAYDAAPGTGGYDRKDMRTVFSRLTSNFAVLALVVVALGATGCAHDRAASKTKPPSARLLLLLERDFAGFIATPLDRDDEGRALDAEAALLRTDRALASLERLRLRYLDLLRDDVEERARITALVRLGELHLDLGARIRRLPYPTEATRDQKIAFDARLSRIALPLEATGLGILEQAKDFARRVGVSGRMVNRADLYLALHRDRAPLDDAKLSVLESELASGRSFPAPRRLLEGGRIGQRAARAGR